MTTARVLLPDMPSNSKFHEVRVKIVIKTPLTQNPGKMRFQSVVMRDEAGNTMRMSLFGEDVCVYNQVFVVDKFYDVLNVTVKEERPGSPYGHGEVMYVNAATVVKPVDVEPDDHLYQGQFKTISAALALESMEQVFDLACVVADTTASVPQHTRMGTTLDMAKFHITDDSYSELVDVTLWGAAASYVDVFRNNDSAQRVITFEGIRKSAFGGKMEFTNSYGCVVKLSPVGSRVSELTEWYGKHQKDVAALLEAVEQPETDAAPEEVESISVCLQMKAYEVQVGQAMQFLAKVDDFTDSSVRTSAGCSRCGRAASIPVGHRFLCSSCKRPTTCIARLYFDFTVRDETGCLPLSAQTRAVERILGITAHTYYMETVEERRETLRRLRCNVCNTPRKWVVTLSPSLLENNKIVKWNLKIVVVDA